MAKMTKAAVKKRLSEAASKMDAVMYGGGRHHLTVAQQKKVHDFATQLLLLIDKIK